MNRTQVRRATIEDLPQLRTLWEMENLPVEALEKRFTEFQVAQTEKGEIVAALGMQMIENQGRLHGETIAWPDWSEDLRVQLWTRMETLARNQGLSRVWTSLETPFWKGVGFKKVSEETLAAKPAAFAEESGAWLALPLRATDAGGDEVEKQMAVLRAMSQAEHEQFMERARVLKWIAVGLMTAIFGAVAVWVVNYVRIRGRLKKRENRE